MDNRKEYWNKDYFEYWKKRVEESNNTTQNKSNIVKNDTKASSDDNYLEAIDLVQIKPNDVVLEMGCGFGRSLPFLHNRSKNLYAVDISEAMIEAAKENYTHLEGINFFVTESENTPFENNFFDVIVCYASFDAMYQEKAIKEFNRILKPNGKLLFTGKNDNYHDDDQLAIVAEVNARKKGHPNHFTDLKWFTENIEKTGFKVIQQRFFERRGDISENKYQTNMPSKFYEYLMLIEKTRSQLNEDLIFANKYSKTFKRNNK